MSVVDEMIAGVRYDPTGDQMRPMMECDEQALRALLAKLVRDSARLDWLAAFRYLHGEARVIASDGLPACMDWMWDSEEERPLRVEIDGAMSEPFVVVPEDKE